MDDKFRMYGLVPYNLSPIQQGIQFGHAVVEYQLSHGRTKDYKYWANNCKTFIILNGGTTNWDDEYLGTINKHLLTLDQDMDFKFATFHEPDLGHQLTAVVFLVKEEIYNKKDYPDFDGSPNDDEGLREWKRTTFGSFEKANKIMAIREFLSQFRLA